jgi:aspartyl-tRNA(Asn)/glutamyl-tRNA(Gln) amidotransferase subunit A
LFSFSSIKDYHIALLNGTTTCVAAVQHFLLQAQEQQHLNAFIELYTNEALARAAQLDEQRRNEGIRGKLHGVVVGIKDVLCYKGHQVTAASHMLKGFTALFNATAVERLLEEGAIIIGRQNCDEFAMGSSNEKSAYGKVLNAADNSRVPGGSSGGSAVAVQAGLCMVSLGSDTGGSVRQPADFCGVVGLKPTYGRISRHGLIAYASSFDQVGIFANTVTDAGLVLEVIAGKDEYDATVLTSRVEEYSQQLDQQLPPLRIAYFKESVDNEALDPEMKQAFLNKVTALKAVGHTVEAVDFNLLNYVVPTYYVLTTAEASSNLGRYDGVRYGYNHAPAGSDLTSLYKYNRSHGFGDEVKRRILLGTFVLSAGYYDAYFTKAQQVRQKLVLETNRLFDNFDLIISPTVPGIAFQFGAKADPIEMFLADIYTVFANLTGIPAISIPLFKYSSNMPFGLQVMAGREKELLLLRFSQTQVIS